MNVSVDQTNAISFARVAGFMDAEALLRLSARMDELVSEFGEQSSKHCRLIDLGLAKAAPPTAIAAVGDEISDPRRLPLRAKRVAYFGASPLVQQQVRRLRALRPGLALFDNRQAAHAWLMARNRGREAVVE